MTATSTAPDAPRRERRDRTADVLRVAVAVVVGLLAGALTFVSQSSLPAWIDSIANSASGWSLVAALVVLLTTVDAWRGAVLAPVVMLALNAGYAVAAELDGLYYDARIWLVVAVVAGPAVGAASAVLRERTVRAGVAHGFLGGLLVAECVTAYATVLDSTSPVYWTLVGLGGLALLVRGARRPEARVGALVAFAVTLGGALLAGRVLEAAFHVV